MAIGSLTAGARCEVGDSAPAWLTPALAWAPAYWNRVRGTDQLPSRRWIDPVALPHEALPLIFLLEKEDRTWRVRLAGTGFHRIYGREVTGCLVSEVIDVGGPGAVVHSDIALSADARLPVFTRSTMTWRPEGVTLTYHRVLLPFAAAAAGAEVRFLLGTLSLLDPP